ncbi:3-hydroxyacyl-CoA dehydrogenase [Amycolatopsis sp. FDAARGOS 1241]|uniref:3-hydroxyacyl-CoA dehydrogenase n=1 Tax=Amycolatopsis sp. FDAARGOS 1241 TaxID=2778070 RepID=UPI00195235D5|nr:3-hydroxyacyl-CoA dehydrogenase [Amycolatopsis sp. FDAARGOS 1241]QRP49507.1 3-hydroxyacyl-CoA dehydrogenase [Amycolatopsis sp. FDAARGOS 1241]
MTDRSVAVVGTGAIGVGFLVLFALAGVPVRAWDADAAAFDRARAAVGDRLALLGKHDLLPATLGEISYHEDLADAVAGVALVQECAPEDVALKRALFADLAVRTRPDTVLASSSSALVPSSFGTGLGGRVLGAHPGNPPYLLPVIELIPAPDTRPEILASAREVYEGAGLKPVLVRKEVEGFVFNRLQGALLREAYCLLRDGVASVEDIDEVVRSGLGRRWSVLGPFETVDLNTRGGIEAHAARMGPAYARMGAERGQHDPWTDDLVALATQQRRALVPLSDWDARVSWRDEQLMRLRAALRRER